MSADEIDKIRDAMMALKVTTKPREWDKITPECPPEGFCVQTCIMDEKGQRNVQPLIRKHGHWFYPDLSMYVYYTPTHWG